MASISSGELDSRITFLIPIVFYNSFNEPEEVMGDFVEVWAKRRDVSSSESFHAQEISAELTTRFTVRWSTELSRVDSRYRILYGDREFNITGTREVGRREWMEIDAVVRSETHEEFDVTSP